MDSKLFATVFATVFLAEIGDKTQLATMLFAADSKHGSADRWTVFAAASAALVLAAGIGVAGGALIGQFVSPRVLTRIAAVAFVAIGVWTWFKA